MSLKDSTNDEIRRALFDTVVELLEAARRKHSLLSAFNISPNVFTLQLGNGHMLTIDTGNDQALLRGTVRWQPGVSTDRDAPWTFSVSRSVDGARLVMSNGPEGSLHDIASNIVS